EIPKDFAGLIEHLRAYVEGVVQAAILLDGFDDGLLAFAEEDVMAAEDKAGRTGGSKAACIFAPEYFAVKFLGVLEIVYRNRPVNHCVELKHSHDFSFRASVQRLSCESARTNGEYLVARLEGESRVAHKNTAARLGQRAVRHQAGDDVLGARDGLGTHFDALLGIDAGDDARRTIDLAVDPNLPVVIDVCLKQHSAVGECPTMSLSRYFNGDAIPSESKTYGETFANVSADPPPRVVVIR